ncbi:hypothetical protein [Bifidobacterium merycicum]|uniref:Cell division protein FtsL n=1 Tax=Bifidobacterium merycicum TaxID=78345 RepID=A0A087BKJ0_9BIFI|nr:hypothetical protein [Bifidobacterium merycicum]KFI71540.1 hypothetical protein BMERY_1047 [Bifidobacterium merycicum]MBQ1512909.1 hypothetical protein [Bifidobacterium sp.]MEE1294441.1 hypothetical protein [Bifidobacterium merycicum]SHE43491.1 hypothetical protein SAMN02745589_0631 [Bifidobacterium merycicum DSM 6492]
MATARTIRSSEPSSRKASPDIRPSARPELHVMSGGKDTDRDGSGASRFTRFIAWASSRRAPAIRVVIAVVILVSTLLCALVLRTQMIQNSFDSSRLEASISSLTQDVQDDQAKLNQLQASLPQKATDMGMIPQQGSVSIDLKGYKSNGERK